MYGLNFAGVDEAPVILWETNVVGEIYRSIKFGHKGILCIW